YGGRCHTLQSLNETKKDLKIVIAIISIVCVIILLLVLFLLLKVFKKNKNNNEKSNSPKQAQGDLDCLAPESGIPNIEKEKTCNDVNTKEYMSSAEYYPPSLPLEPQTSTSL
ncbi:unnamed protein product, partial [Lymnaea stagnalis]